MSDYTPTTDFSAKDSLPSGNASKLIKGSEFDTEFAAIQTAVASKVDDDVELAAIAGLTSAANKVPRFTGSGTAEVIDIVYGTYTPTLTAGTNVATVTAPGLFNYTRIGTIVEVSGLLNVDPTSGTTSTEWQISLPVASNFANVQDAAGVFSTVSGYSGIVYADAANDTLKVSLTWGSGTSVATSTFTAKYLII